ncbi:MULTISPECIES: tyrosine-type recombinase/integrase [Nonomuraea]|uniref:Tyrosine-type recombinase/integrase n=1 Tax=Nonomuraea mangrovi TaxID=2316207 RepID=A0ABW4TFP6_9ACTN
MSARIIALHEQSTERSTVTAVAERALAAIERYLDRCKLSPHTVKAYRRQCAAYVAWLAEHAAAHPDAFDDVVGAEAAVTAWRRHLLKVRKDSPSTVNQARAAVTLMYEHAAQLRIKVKSATVPRPGEPDALTRQQQGALERAAVRRGVRDAAIIYLLLYTGARAEESVLDLEDLALTARTGSVRLHGKGDQVRNVPVPAPARERLSAWLLERGSDPGPLWMGQRGPLTVSGITQVVLAAGEEAGLKGVRPHDLRHTYATRLRQEGADPAQVQALLGHAKLDTTARYFRAGQAELEAVVERVFD